MLEIMERREDVQNRVAELTAERDQLAADAERTAAPGTRRRPRSPRRRGRSRASARRWPADCPVSSSPCTRRSAAAGGAGAAALRRGRCEGCRMELPSTELAAMRPRRRTSWCAARSAAGFSSACPTRACERPWVAGWSSRRTVPLAAIPARPPTGPWCATRTPVRCWPNARTLGHATNNVAEYSGLIAALEAAFGLDPSASVEVRMDSKLVIEQMAGRWQIKHANLKPLAQQGPGVDPGAGRGPVDLDPARGELPRRPAGQRRPGRGTDRCLAGQTARSEVVSAQPAGGASRSRRGPPRRSSAGPRTSGRHHVAAAAARRHPAHRRTAVLRHPDPPLSERGRGRRGRRPSTWPPRRDRRHREFAAEAGPADRGGGGGDARPRGGHRRRPARGRLRQLGRADLRRGVGPAGATCPSG